MQIFNRSASLSLTVLAAASLALAGCGSKAKLNSPPVSVSGKVSQAGQPVSGVVMVFQPLENGHVRELPVQNDGSFSGEFVAGKYAYYVTKPAAISSATPSKVPAQYFQADLSRTVEVEPGTQLAIALD
jgi:predicted small lipoprotein YifL